MLTERMSFDSMYDATGFWQVGSLFMPSSTRSPLFWPYASIRYVFGEFTITKLSLPNSAWNESTESTYMLM